MKKDWEICPLDKYVKFIDYRGHTPTKTSSGMRLITAKNVKEGFLQREPEEFVDPKIYDKWMVRGFPKNGDVLFTTEAPLANVAQLDTDEKVLFAQRIIIFQPQEDKIDQTFLKYLLLSEPVRKQIFSKGTGATVQGIKARLLKTVEIPVPPIPEQERIVSMLDEAFASIEQAKANAELNLVNARELFEALLNEYFGHPRKGWKEMKLNDACIVERGSSPRPIKKYQTTSKDGVNWIKIGDTKGVEKYIYSTREKITREGAEKSRFVKEGDFILTNSMSFGNPYIMKTEGYIHDGWFVLRLKEFIDSEFFWFLLVSPFVQNQFNQLASGAIVKNISGDLVKKAKLFIPPLAEQRAIVGRLEALSAETGRLEEIYQQKVESLEELKKSVLGKAFAGEL